MKPHNFILLLIAFVALLESNVPAHGQNQNRTETQKVNLANDGIPAGVIVSVVRQMTVESPPDVPTATRGILFRVTNNSKRTIYLSGLWAFRRFLPHGFLVRYEEEKGWVGPNGSTELPTFDEYKKLADEKYALGPGRYLDFTESQHFTFRGKRFKCYVFLSKSKSDRPERVESAEFILR